MNIFQNMLKVGRECAKIQSALECMTKLAKSINVEKRKQEQLDRQKLISNRIFSAETQKVFQIFFLQILKIF